MVDNIIKQTSRAILFEEFDKSSESPKLDIIISNPEESFELKYSNVKKELEVTSFEDFMKKFAPKYYDCIGTTIDENGNKSNYYSYTLDKTQRSSTNEYELKNQPFFNAIMEIYEKKGNSATSDFSFDFNNILERIYNPRTAREKISNTFDKLKYNFTQYQKYEALGNKVQMQVYAKQIMGLRKHLRNEYLSKTQFNMLPLVIDEINRLLDTPSLIKGIKEKLIVKDTPGEFFIENSGMPKIKNIQTQELNVQQTKGIEAHNNDTEIIYSSAPVPVEDRIIAILSKDFDNAKDEGKNRLVVPDNPGSTELMKKMYLSLFAGAENAFKDCDIGELKKYLNDYRLMYKAANEHFASQVVVLVEKIIGVKAFFEHAGGSANLIISNVSLERLMDENNRPYFEEFIRCEGQERNEEKIWLSIIPAVFNERICKNLGNYNETISDYSLDQNISDYNEDIQTTPTELLSFETFKVALKLLCKNNIITFFNFKAGKDSNSGSLKKETIQIYKEILEPITMEDYSARAVFCYPNFTILPEGHSSAQSQDRNANDNINLPSVYLDSAYVACGLTIFTQNIENLKEGDFPVKSNHCQPVRFDFEGKFTKESNRIKVPLALIFPTTLNRESIFSWNRELIDEISKDGGFGFCFCGDEKWYDCGNGLKRQDHAYVFRARTLHKKNGRYYPIYKTYVKLYLDIIIHRLNFDKDSINKYLSTYTKTEESKKFINNLLYSPSYSGVREEEQIEVKTNELNNGTGLILINYGEDTDDFHFIINDDYIL